MKKGFRYYAISWAVVLAVFNALTFIIMENVFDGDYPESFWLGWTLINVGFLGQIACVYNGFRKGAMDNLFYNIPVMKTSYGCLIVAAIVGLFVMLVNMPTWIGGILCLIIMAFCIVSISKSLAAASIVSEIDKKIKVQTFFIKSLTVDAQTLMARATSEEAKVLCNKVYEAARYSDPMSNDALAAVESQITVRFAALSSAVAAGDEAQIKAAADEMLILLEHRNNKCKLLK